MTLCYVIFSYQQCVGTSDNIVKTLLPMLKTAVMKEKPVLAVRFLEKAKRWIHDIIKEVEQIVKKQIVQIVKHIHSINIQIRAHCR